MNVNYYNEFDKGAAAWLRELISQKLIPFGYVDERSITEVTASDVQGFTQCHFFAGIAGWPLALRLAGIPDTFPLWTGSPPCQPFSVAGAGKGRDDPRHLAPTFLDLVAECRPQYLFGEQVAAAVTKDQWADALLIELAEEDYACGFAVLPACGVGAPHKRDRLFFGAKQLVHANSEHIPSTKYGEGAAQSGRTIAAFSRMAHTNDTRPQGREGMPECADQQSVGSGSVESELADSDHDRQQSGCGGGGSGESPESRNNAGRDGATNPTNPHHSFWSDADWLGCRDGKFRTVEPGTFPLANGIPARVGRLRGYGNAIVPQVAAEFVKAFISSK